MLHKKAARGVVLKVILISTFSGLLATSAKADLVNGNILITADENCHGTINGFAGLSPLPCGFQNDPGPGGLNGVMTYNLLNPPGLVAGDVLLTESGGILDVVRFNPGENSGSLVFYSDNLDGFDSLADTTGPPRLSYNNFVLVPELGTEANNGAIYTPLAGQPGFVAGASAPGTYDLISAGVGAPVPEPGTLTLFGSGLIGLAGLIKKRSQR